MTDTVKIDNLIEELGKMTLSLAQIAGDLPTAKPYKVATLHNSNITTAGSYTLSAPEGYSFSDLKGVFLQVCVMADTLNPANLFFMNTSPVWVGITPIPYQERIPCKYNANEAYDTISWGLQASGNSLEAVVSSISNINVVSIKVVGIFY